MRTFLKTESCYRQTSCRVLVILLHQSPVRPISPYMMPQMSSKFPVRCSLANFLGRERQQIVVIPSTRFASRSRVHILARKRPTSCRERLSTRKPRSTNKVEHLHIQRMQMLQKGIHCRQCMQTTLLLAKVNNAHRRK